MASCSKVLSPELAADPNCWKELFDLIEGFAGGFGFGIAEEAVEGFDSGIVEEFGFGIGIAMGYWIAEEEYLIAGLEAAEKQSFGIEELG